MNARSITHIARYAAWIAVLGLLPKFSIPVAGVVPITAQTLGVMLAGVMLGPVHGFLACMLFLFVVALGLPLLAGGRGGVGVFFAPSVGFLVGWPLGAFVAGALMKSLIRVPIFAAAAVCSHGRRDRGCLSDRHPRTGHDDGFDAWRVCDWECSLPAGRSYKSGSLCPHREDHCAVPAGFTIKSGMTYLTHLLATHAVNRPDGDALHCDDSA